MLVSRQEREVKPCKAHATWRGEQNFEPRADGYCTDACREYGLAHALRGLIDAVVKEVPDNGCYSEVYEKLRAAREAF